MFTNLFNFIISMHTWCIISNVENLGIRFRSALLCNTFFYINFWKLILSSNYHDCLLYIHTTRLFSIFPNLLLFNTSAGLLSRCPRHTAPSCMQKSAKEQSIRTLRKLSLVTSHVLLSKPVAQKRSLQLLQLI